jgi:A/G-specific adenine glycosylase
MTMCEETFADAVLGWYRASGRVLPWRETRDPYAILVSEVMLQQTQVSRVVERYTAWVARWPTAAALAEAPPAEVIAAWSGLGYNNRAVRLHAAARRVARDGWPTSYEGLRTLPGVGPYTAAAVACLAFGEDRLPIDVNIRRVLHRALERDSIAPPPGRTADLTQALFDLGATVCIARRPRCGACPLAGACPSRGRTYEPERKQGRFEGSRRQARGALLRQVAAGGVALADADTDIAEALARDGLVAIASGRITLPGE